MNLIRIHYLDASAIVKLFVAENGSERIRNYFGRESVFHTTSLCFSEALGVLKSKYFRRGEISEEEYLSHTDELFAMLKDETIQLEDVEIDDRSVFDAAESLVRTHKIDVSDAFQIISVKSDYFSRFDNESKPILITADADLAKAAEKEGLRVWNVLEEDEPKDAEA